MILGNLERNDLWEIWSNRPGVPPLVPNEELPGQPVVRLAITTCPSDSPEPRGLDSNGRKLPDGPTSFVVNGGWVGDNTNRANGVFFRAFETPGDPPPAVVSSNFLSTADGVSNTLMMSENIQADQWQHANQIRQDLYTFVWHRGDPPLRINQERRERDISKLSESVAINYARPSSNHPGGVNMAFCETRIKFIQESIDYRIYRQLMTSNSTSSASDEAPLDDSTY